MEKFEYISTLFYASEKNNLAAESLAYYNSQLGTRTEPGKYSPIYLMGKLNKLGAQGWELIQMTPVLPGKNDDILVHEAGNSIGPDWSNGYLCVFRRRLPQ